MLDFSISSVNMAILVSNLFIFSGSYFPKSQDHVSAWTSTSGWIRDSYLCSHDISSRTVADLPQCISSRFTDYHCR